VLIECNLSIGLAYADLSKLTLLQVDLKRLFGASFFLLQLAAFFDLSPIDASARNRAPNK
jgi:hypothetical protein